MISRSLSRKAPADSVMSVPGPCDYSAPVCGSRADVSMAHHMEEIGMAASGPDEEFKVTDRRRRGDDEPVTSPAASPAPAAGGRAATAAPEERSRPAAPAAEPHGASPPSGRPTLE